MSDVNIRKITDSDLLQCASVIREAFSTVAKDFDLTQENSPTNPAFISLERLTFEKENGSKMYGLFAEEELAGFVALDDKGEGVFELKRVAVLPACRHKGYGKALLDFAKEKILSWGGHKITIGIIEENTVLKNWYASYGFVSTGTKVFPHLPFSVGFMEMEIIKTEI